MKTLKAKKDDLIQWLTDDVIKDEEIEVIHFLLNTGLNDKREMLKFAGYSDKEQKQIDTATPIDYTRKIKEIYPNFKPMNCVFDYNEKSFGELINVVDLVGQKIIKVFNNWH